MVTAFSSEIVIRGNCKVIFSSKTASGRSILVRKNERNESVAHEAITTDLYNGVVVEGRSFSENGNQNSMFEVKLYNSKTGRYRVALFKPRFYGDGNGWNRVPMEYVAYELNLLLGMDLVPPAAYRRNLRIGDNHYSEGAVLFKVPDTHPLRRVKSQFWDSEVSYKKIDKDLFLSDTRVLDVLLQNPDRHIDNFMRGKHWVDGFYRPFLIDHAASLRRGTDIRLNQTDAFGLGPINVFRRSTFEALKRLNKDAFSPLREFLSEREISQILQRRDQIISYIENKIRSNGIEATLY